MRTGQTLSSFCLVASSKNTQTIDLIKRNACSLVDVTGLKSLFTFIFRHLQLNNKAPQKRLFLEGKSHHILKSSKRLLTATKGYRWPDPLSSNVSSNFLNIIENFGGNNGLY